MDQVWMVGWRMCLSVSTFQFLLIQLTCSYWMHGMFLWWMRKLRSRMLRICFVVILFVEKWNMSVHNLSNENSYNLNSDFTLLELSRSLSIFRHPFGNIITIRTLLTWNNCACNKIERLKFIRICIGAVSHANNSALVNSFSRLCCFSLFFLMIPELNKTSIKIQWLFDNSKSCRQ